MRTPSIAHYGVTISEMAPDPGVEQKDAPILGALRGGLEFFRHFGFEPHVTNYYPGVGRQYIWRRGNSDDVDYVEMDNFTSYSAKPRPVTPGPRQGDTIFRLTHSDVRRVFRELKIAKLIQYDEQAGGAFECGAQESVLVDAANGQRYEMTHTQPTTADNNVVYIWSATAEIQRICGNYQTHFGLRHIGSTDFHGIGRVELLRREQPGISIGLLHSSPHGLSPRFSEDIFGEAGYSHFRLGAPNKTLTETSSRQAFPPTGDVSYIYFEDSYLELVQV